MKDKNLQEFEPGFEIKHENIFDDQKVMSKKDLLWTFRHSQPFVNIQSLPDDSVSFIVNSGQTEFFPLPSDISMLQITSNVNVAGTGAALIIAFGAIPATPVQIQGILSGAAVNTNNLSHGFLQADDSAVYFCPGTKNIGFHAIAQNVVVGLKIWKHTD